MLVIKVLLVFILYDFKVTEANCQARCEKASGRTTTVTTGRPGYFKQAIGTFTPIHTTGYIVSSRMLVMAPLHHQVEKITLDVTTQSTLYTDAPRGIMLQRSGGLENSKFIIQRIQTSSTQ